MLIEEPIINPVVVLALAAAGIAVLLMVIALINYKKGKLMDTPNSLHFRSSDREYRPGDGFVDYDSRKVGKTRTLKSYYAAGFISWEELFAPRDKKQEMKRKRKMAAKIIVFTMILLFSLFVVFALLDMIWPMMLMLLLMVYLIFLITVKFLTFRVFSRIKY